jgi:hypothetical protein
MSHNDPNRYERIGRDDREAAIKRLQQATVTEHLTLDDFMARMESAMQASTRLDLDRLLRDLPPPRAWPWRDVAYGAGLASLDLAWLPGLFTGGYGSHVTAVTLAFALAGVLATIIGAVMTILVTGFAFLENHHGDF